MEAEISQEYIEIEKAQFGKIPDSESIHGEEQQYFCNEHTIAGEDQTIQERAGKTQEFFKMEDALHEELQEDGKMSRQATP